MEEVVQEVRPMRSSDDDSNAKASHRVQDSLDEMVKEMNSCSIPPTPERKGEGDGVQDDEEQEGSTQVGEESRKRVQEARSALVAREPDVGAATLSALNAKATDKFKAGELEQAIAIYEILFEKAQRNNLTHPELFVCYGNCAAAYLKLALYEEAMVYAEKSSKLAESSLRRSHKGLGTYVKSFCRKGHALMGMGRHREAVMTFEKGLKIDPLNPDLKLGLQRGNAAVLKDLAEGKSQEHRTITYPETSQLISYHPYSAPLHRIRTEDMLPLKLLTPFQAENDHHIKDTYNYMTVQADIRMPEKMFAQFEDSYFNQQYRKAIEAAVAHIESTDTDCRVLNLGAGAGVQAVHALKAGARHVTAVERWLYLALACKETMVENEMEEEKYSVIYKRPVDLKIKTDVPICCNVLVANLFDKGLLSSGIVPAVRHALENDLVMSDAIVMPSSATVYAQAVEIRIKDVVGVDMSPANLYRWCLNQSPLGRMPVGETDVIRPLSDPVSVWYFDFVNPPTKNETKSIDFTFTDDGRLNAVMYWYEVHLYGDIYLSSMRDVVAKEHHESFLQPSVQYLAGELRVSKDTTMQILASHNTVRMQFDIESADYIHLMKRDSSFPHNQYEMLSDSSRIESYKRAIERAVKEVKEEHGEVHVLDMGTGSGILSILAAKAGASSVVACDIHDSLCDVARKAVAANNVSKVVSVVNRDVALLQRGKEVRPLGVNMLVADMFDCGLVGDQFEYILSLTRRKVAQPDAKVIPQAASIYCVGIESLTQPVEGVNLSSFDKYRWDSQYHPIDASRSCHTFKILTDPVKVTEIFFDSENRKNTREMLLKLQATRPGILNGVLFWFDLHLDDLETISNAPTCPGLPSSSSTTSKSHHWHQAMQYLDRAVPLDTGRKVTMLCRRDGSKLHFKLRQGIGATVERAPWKIEWGGGASVENPHFQRVHYCELLVRDFLMRCKSNRFPPIEKDINMVLAHCGSLFLDPESVEQAGHELVVLEKLHRNPEFSPGASLDAITKKPMYLC